MDRVTLVHGNFRDLAASSWTGLDLPGVDGMLFDLGVSSPQLDDAEQGLFLYARRAPGHAHGSVRRRSPPDDVVNTWPQEELRRILLQLRRGDGMPPSDRCAPSCGAGRKAPIETTLELVDVIRSAMPAAALREKQHPAKRTLSGHPHRRQRRAGRDRPICFRTRCPG